MGSRETFFRSGGKQEIEEKRINKKIRKDWRQRFFKKERNQER